MWRKLSVAVAQTVSRCSANWQFASFCSTVIPIHGPPKRLERCGLFKARCINGPIDRSNAKQSMTIEVGKGA